MEFSVINESMKLCIDGVRSYIREKRLYQSDTILDTYPLHIGVIHNHYHPILCTIFPDPLSRIIIEYSIEVHIINVIIRQYGTGWYLISIKNNILRLDHKYYLSISNITSKINIFNLNVTRIQPFVHSNLIGYHGFIINHYLSKYYPKLRLNKKFDYAENHYTKDADITLDSITDKEQFKNELIIIVALFNNLQQLDISKN